MLGNSYRENLTLAIISLNSQLMTISSNLFWLIIQRQMGFYFIIQKSLIMHAGLNKEQLKNGLNQYQGEIKAWPNKTYFIPLILLPAEVLDNLYIYIMSHDSSDFYFITAFLLLFGHSFAFIRLIFLIKIYYFGYFNIKTDKNNSIWHQIINNYLKRINRLYFKPKTIKNHAKLVFKGIMKIFGLVFLGLIAIYFNI